MHIAEVTATNQWQKLEDLIAQKVSGFTFNSGKEYIIQNPYETNIYDLFIIEYNSIPSQDLRGFVKEANETPFIYTKTTGDLYVRSKNKITIAIAED